MKEHDKDANTVAFKIGDFVIIKPHGLKMKVTKISQDGELIGCQWTHEPNKRMEVSIKTNYLTLWEPEVPSSVCQIKNEPDFKAGDFVKLKEGLGPIKMQVKTTVQPDDGFILCQWFVGNTLHEGTFTPETLKMWKPRANRKGTAHASRPWIAEV